MSFSDVLKPGSSLDSTFLLILDGAFTFLLLVLISLAYLTSGNIHIFALTAIELALWASVKWYVDENTKRDTCINGYKNRFVNELKNTPLPPIEDKQDGTREAKKES